MAGKKLSPGIGVSFASACQVCGTSGAGPGGMCSGCAGGVMGITTKPCPQCGNIYSTNDAACPACMAAHQARALLVGGTPAPQYIKSDVAKTEPLPRADMQVRDLIGWRVWRITSMGYLRSLTAEAIWLPGVPMEAMAVVDDYGASKKGGSDLGIHVFAERNAAIIEAEQYTTGRGVDANYAVGSVLLWGEVVEHERGYRAERAKIRSIDDVTWKGKPPWDKETAEVLAFLRARYGVGQVGPLE